MKMFYDITSVRIKKIGCRKKEEIEKMMETLGLNLPIGMKIFFVAEGNYNTGDALVYFQRLNL